MATYFSFQYNVESITRKDSPLVSDFGENNIRYDKRHFTVISEFRLRICSLFLTNKAYILNEYVHLIKFL